MKIGKFKLGERVKADVGIKTDFPAVGIIEGGMRKLDRYIYLIRFDRPLEKEYAFNNLSKLWVGESKITREK